MGFNALKCFLVFVNENDPALYHGQEFFFSHTRFGFPLFLPCEIELYHIPVQADHKMA